jgi:hypothetical protein
MDLDKLFTPPPSDLPRGKAPAPDTSVTIEWGDADPKKIIARFRADEGVKKELSADAARKALAVFRARAATAPSTCDELFAAAPDDVLLETLALPPEMWIFFDERDVDFILARLGEKIVPRIIELDQARKVADEALLRIRCAHVVQVAANHTNGFWLDQGVIHHEWLAKHAAYATPILVHTILTGQDDAVRRDARNAARWLARLDEGRALREACAKTSVKKVADAILAPDTPSVVPDAKIPKSWGAFAPPLLKSGKPLPASHVNKLVGFFAGEPDPSHPFARSVLDAFDAASLREWVEALERVWTTKGSALTHLWLMHAAVLVSGDAAVRRAGTWARTRSTASSRNERTRTGRAIDVLARTPGDVAMAQLSDVATLSKADWTRKRAGGGLAVRLLETKEPLDEILERAVPDLGFGDGIVLDFGPRRFTAHALPDLGVALEDESGARLDELPKPRKSDDAKKAKQAIETLRALKKDLEAVGTVARGRFDEAMRSGRTWKADSFRTHVIAHPLMRVIAQGLVFRTKNKTFRIAEDGSLADEQDRACDLAGDVSIVHPLEIDAAARATWAARLREYKLIQPIPQMEREVFDVKPAAQVKECAGWMLPAGAIMGLLREGWKLSYESSDVVNGARRYLGDDRKVWVGFTPGFEVDDVASARPQKLTALGVSEEEVAHPQARVELSEILRALATRRSRR